MTENKTMQLKKAEYNSHGKNEWKVNSCIN